MIKTFSLVCSILSMVGFCSCSHKQHDQVSVLDPGSETEHVNEKKLRHIVLFKFKEDASKAEISKVEKAFAQLPEKIEEIKGFEWGINNSPENINKGFTHGFVLTFDNEEGRASYLPHPDHKAFGSLLEPVLEDVLVLDYWTN